MWDGEGRVEMVSTRNPVKLAASANKPIHVDLPSPSPQEVTPQTNPWLADRLNRPWSIVQARNAHCERSCSSMSLRSPNVARTGNVESRWLMALRVSACGYFTTVLGPGANAAHAEHYHFDLGMHGKSGSYRICE